MEKVRLGFLILMGIGIAAVRVEGQMDGLRGDFLETRNGTHSGNQFRITFYNDGLFGGNQVPPDIYGEWPINSGHLYLRCADVIVGAEVIDRNGELKHIISSNPRNLAADSPSADDYGPNGERWSFLPLPGFARPGQDKIAMSKWPESWPATWPDKHDDPVDPGWKGSWNGYFGKNVLNADEESYYVADDYANREFAFYPDSTDSLRRGLGIRMYVRGFQWSNALVEDALFILYDLENVGTFEHDKMAFGSKMGNNMGETTTGGDTDDDWGAYDKDLDVAYLWDNDNIGGGGYTPVGYMGGAFLESPGNPYDGIDNDGDGSLGSGPTVTESLFAPRMLQAGEDIVLINYADFSRMTRPMPSDTVMVRYQDQVFKFWPGKQIEEVPNNLVDDNLNGVIDESNGATFGTPPNLITSYLYLGAKYIDYLTGAGKDNPLIDERRNDGVDNDRDWDQRLDDNGQDGVPFTGDPGESDGRPTAGETHFDRTDIDETDMIGLSSFTLFYWPDIPRSDDEKLWSAMIPGYLDDLLQNTNADMLFGSGYFPMKPRQIERFSVGVLMGITQNDFFENKYWVAKAYNENYNFSKAPNIPTVTAVAGDHRVTLQWDGFAEQSVDPITGQDFEGYKIYRSTDPGFRDMIPITDGYGSVTYRKPMAQFDLDNGFQGFANKDVKGVFFFLGANTGLVHTFTDTTARNGQKYFYAVSSYDRGDPVNGIPPSECTRYIAIDQSGNIEKGTNVVIARPEAPSAGFVASELENLKMTAGSTATGRITYKVINPQEILDGHKYRVTFGDSLVTTTPVTRVTKSMTLADVTDADMPDTLIDRSRQVFASDIQPVTAGFQLSIFNEATLTLDAARSEWSRPGLLGFLFTGFSFSQTRGVPEAADYRIEFGGIGLDSSTAFMRGTKEIPGVSVNFRVFKLFPSDTGEMRVRSRFGFFKQDDKAARPNEFSAFRGKTGVSDQIVMLSDDGVPGFMFQMDRATFDSVRTVPDSGDFVTIRVLKPFLSHDAVEFITRKEHIDEDLAKQDLNRIKVVPNPYVVSNSFEPQNPYANGRGPRELHFTHLPMKCTIRIYNVQGQLVAALEHESPSVADGTEIWDMLTRDRMDIAYGVYVFHVDAGKLGTKVGKFAVIK